MMSHPLLLQPPQQQLLLPIPSAWALPLQLRPWTPLRQWLLLHQQEWQRSRRLLLPTPLRQQQQLVALQQSPPSRLLRLPRLIPLQHWQLLPMRLGLSVAAVLQGLMSPLHLPPSRLCLGLLLLGPHLPQQHRHQEVLRHPLPRQQEEQQVSTASLEGGRRWMWNRVGERAAAQLVELTMLQQSVCACACCAVKANQRDWAE